MSGSLPQGSIHGPAIRVPAGAVPAAHRLRTGRARRPTLASLALVAAMAVAGCAQRPATEATQRFSTALSVAASAVDGALADIARDERRLRTLARASEYLSLPPGTRRGPQVLLPSRDPTNADIARGVLSPGFDLLKAYAAHLSQLASPDATSALRSANDGLRTSITRGIDAVASRTALGVPKTVADAAKDGVPVILALMEFAVEQRIARDLTAVVERADGPIQSLGTLLKAVIGQDDAHGLRLSLSTINDQADEQRQFILEQLRTDGLVSLQQRLAAFNDMVASRDQDTSITLLAQLTATIDAMLRAHSALRQPGEASTRRSIDAFVASVERLADIYQRLRTAGR